MSVDTQASDAPLRPSQTVNWSLTVSNLLLVVLSALLTALAFPPTEWWPLAWCGLTPLLLALHRTTTVRAAGWLTLFWGLLFTAVTLHWMPHIFSTATIGVYLLMCLPWVLFGLGYRLLVTRHSSLLLILFAPILWTAIDWVRCEGWYFQFSWLQLGFTQVPWTPMHTCYTLIGTYGVTFLILFVNAAIATIWITKPEERRQCRRTIVTVLSIMLGMLVLLGVWEGYLALAEGQTQRVWRHPQLQPTPVLIVQDEQGGVDKLLTLTRQFSTEHRADTTPMLIVWPEYAIPAFLRDNLRQLNEVQEEARAMHATLVLGCKETAPSGAPCDPLRQHAMLETEGKLFYNTALVIGPDGTILGAYHKAHPIQLFSDGVPGTDFSRIDTPSGLLGISICYDFDYAWGPLLEVRDGAELLVVPTFDDLAWTPLQHLQHSRMVQARAAELGRWVARATSSGISQIISPHGEVVNSIPIGVSAALLGQVTPSHLRTPYVLFTWMLPHACLLLSIFGSVVLLVSTIRARKAHQVSDVSIAAGEIKEPDGSMAVHDDSDMRQER